LERLSERMGIEIPQLEIKNEPTGTVQKPNFALSQDSKMKLIAAVEASGMPDNRKQRVLSRLNESAPPREFIERISDRMGIDVPELLTPIQPTQPSAIQTSPVSAQSDMVALSDESKDMLIARVQEASMPDFVKTRLLGNLEKGQIPRENLERMTLRMGIKVPELN